MLKHPVYSNLLQFETLTTQESLFSFTTTIQGGVSKGNYSSFNLGMYSGDQAKNVLENRQRLKQQIETTELYLPYQIHEDKITVIDDNFLNQTEDRKEQLLYGVDAIITNKRNICIGVSTADCVPILIYDPQNKVLAVIHAGWRGTVAKLPQKVVLQMISSFKCNPQQLLVGIGPSISQKNFEVGNEVISAFDKANFRIDQIAIKNKKTRKYHIDLWESNQFALKEQGILTQNIEISKLCTFERSDLFFSARRQTIHSGRIITGGILL